MTPSQISQALRKIASKIDSSKQPSRRLVAAELRKIVADMLPQDPAPQKSQAEWEQMFYGQSGPIPHEPGVAVGSGAFWQAFEELGWLDWTPASDLKAVEAKLGEIWQRIGPQLPGTSLEEWLEDVRDNYESYKSYEPAYVSGQLTSPMGVLFGV